MTALLDQWNEKSTMPLVVSFFDDSGAPVTPNTATYRIDDQMSGTAILASTSITGLSTVNELIVTSTQNRILNDANVQELRSITVEFDYNGSTRHGTAEYVYALKNMRFVS